MNLSEATIDADGVKHISGLAFQKKKFGLKLMAAR